MCPLKERRCIICLIKFKPTRWWQRVCNKIECQKESMRRNSKNWRREHPKYHKKYNQDYAKI